MAELNYFDPPDPAGNEPHYPDIEDRRKRDFGDWERGRWLDPTPFTHVMDEAWRLQPGSYLPSDLPPAGPLTPMGAELGGAALDRANAAMEKLRQPKVYTLDEAKRKKRR